MEYKCDNPIFENPGARLEELIHSKCGKPALPCKVKSLYNRKEITMNLCEEHYKERMGIENLIQRDEILAGAGVPFDVRVNTFKRDAQKVILKK